MQVLSIEGARVADERASRRSRTRDREGLCGRNGGQNSNPDGSEKNSALAGERPHHGQKVVANRRAARPFTRRISYQIDDLCDDAVGIFPAVWVQPTDPPTVS